MGKVAFSILGGTVAEADPGAPASDEAGPPSPAAVIPGTTGNDSLTGTAADDTIFTGEGNDFLDGRGGDDLLLGGNDGDTLLGGLGNDLLFGERGGDTIDGGDGDDILIGELGDDILDGGGGDFDIASYVLSPGGVTVNLDTVARSGVGASRVLDGHGTTDQLTGIEEVQGSDFGDRVFGGPTNDVLVGWDGADTLLGGAGADLIEGGDTLDGGDGHDRILYNYDEANGGLFGVTVDLGNGTATDGFGDTDSLIDIESVRGTSFADTLIGGRDLDEHFGEEFVGLSGDDTISGLGGRSLVLELFVAFHAAVRVVTRFALLPGKLDAVDALVPSVDESEIVLETTKEPGTACSIGTCAIGQHWHELFVLFSGVRHGGGTSERCGKNQGERQHPRFHFFLPMVGSTRRLGARNPETGMSEIDIIP